MNCDIHIPALDNRLDRKSPLLLLFRPKEKLWYGYIRFKGQTLLKSGSKDQPESSLQNLIHELILSKSETSTVIPADFKRESNIRYPIIPIDFINRDGYDNLTFLSTGPTVRNISWINKNDLMVNNL
jgi:hypothetical protein